MYLSYASEMNPIRDQGSQGTCAAMAGAAMKEWQEKQDVAYGGYMSPQFIYNLRSNAPAEGMYMRDLMNILRNYGDCFEEDFVYWNLSEPNATVLGKAAQYKISAYAQVLTIEGLKNALYANGPCVMAVPVLNTTTRLWHAFEGDTYIGGHAMAVVGYNPFGFIIRNSWGNYWGVEGLTLFPYSDWGDHWEVWTTIDADSGSLPVVPPEPDPVIPPEPDPVVPPDPDPVDPVVPPDPDPVDPVDPVSPHDGRGWQKDWFWDKFRRRI